MAKQMSKVLKIALLSFVRASTSQVLKIALLLFGHACASTSFTGQMRMTKLFDQTCIKATERSQGT